MVAEASAVESGGALAQRGYGTRALGRDYLLVLGIVLASRALLAVVAFGVHFGSAADGSVGDAQLPSLLFWWDAGAYVRIASLGYSPFSIVEEQFSGTAHAYFPVFPLLVRAASLFGMEPMTAGIVVATSMSRSRTA
jgi:hypothetical protein